MYGCYSNIRLNENERKILKDEPDDYIWYKCVLSKVFQDNNNFEVRQDIEIPQDEDDDGVLLMVDDGSLIYFKTLEGNFDNIQAEKVSKVCSFIENTFNCPFKVYVACRTNFCINHDDDFGISSNVYFARIYAAVAEKIVDELESKLVANEEFTISDSINHILLPFLSYKDKDVFEEKYAHYMDLINSYGGK